MKILDYVFYRLYMYFKKNKETPVATASIVITGFLLGAFPAIWYGLPYLIFGWEPTTKYIRILEYLFIYLIIYLLWYRPRENYIISKYKHSKYNERIPYWVILLSLFLFTIIALCLQLPSSKWIKDNHYDGIVLKWFLGLFE